LLVGEAQGWSGEMRQKISDLKTVGTIVSGFTLAIMLTVVSAVSMTPRPASALPAYAQQTGVACGRCHVNPAGGGPNTAFGKAFAANGHKLPSKKKK
jgi:mono/diheme cytochrome c family protein